MSNSYSGIINRDVNGGWTEWAIAHPGFGRMKDNGKVVQGCTVLSRRIMYYLPIMAILVVEFSSGGYKIRKIFA